MISMKALAAIGRDYLKTKFPLLAPLMESEYDDEEAV